MAHRGIAVFVAAGLVLIAAPQTSADVFEVDRFDDPFPAQTCASPTAVDCSLREAILTANAAAGPDLILVPAGTYTLTRTGAEEDAAVTGDLDLTDTVRIEGAGMTETIFDGGGPGVLDDRILDIHGVEVEIDGLTLRGGSGVLKGGGLLSRSNSTLTLTSTMILSNRADTTAGYGGAAAVEGTCTILDSVIRDNEASRAGGIDTGETTVIQDSFIEDNRALADFEWSGGGILTFGSNSMTTLIRTVVSGNTSARVGGGLHALGPTYILDSTFENNHAAKLGGAISVGPLMTVTIEKSSFWDNTSDDSGGAIGVEDQGTLEIMNSTVHGNDAVAEGGAFGVEGTATLTHVTIADNTAPTATAVMGTASSDISFGATILAGSCTLDGVATTLGSNLESPGNSCRLDETIDQVDVFPTDLKLSPLGYYGGSSASQLLLPGSVAIDAVATCPPPAEDQRGVFRPIDGDGDTGAVCDIGAVEVNLNELPQIFVDDFESGDTSGWSTTVP